MIDGAALVAIGVAASVLILSGWSHQILKGYRTKSLQDVSKYLMILIGVGAILWLIYGLVLSDPYIIGTNVTALVLIIIIFLMKRKYDMLGASTTN